LLAEWLVHFASIAVHKMPQQLLQSHSGEGFISSAQANAFLKTIECPLGIDGASMDTVDATRE
jgi:hypothetical protein